MFTKLKTESEEIKRYIEMNESQWKIYIYSSSIVDNWTGKKAVPVQKLKTVKSGKKKKKKKTETSKQFCVYETANS